MTTFFFNFFFPNSYGTGYLALAKNKYRPNNWPHFCLNCKLHNISLIICLAHQNILHTISRRFGDLYKKATTSYIKLLQMNEERLKAFDLLKLFECRKQQFAHSHLGYFIHSAKKQKLFRTNILKDN